MSSYNRITKHPQTKQFENALWLDDYFGSRRYGVKFPSGEVFPADDYKWEIKENYKWEIKENDQ